MSDENRLGSLVRVPRPDAHAHTKARRELAQSWGFRPVAVPTTGPQLVVVFDTNAIATACCMEARSGHQSLLTRLELMGTPCFIADHVPAEVDEHLERIARKRGVSPSAAAFAWRTQIAPLFRVVDLPIGEYLRPEIAAVRQPKPAGDPDDWPSLALAAFLGPAAIVTRDSVFHRLGYANDVEDWTDTAKVLHRVALLELEQIDRVIFSIMGTRLVSAGIGGLVRILQRFPWTVPVAAAATALVARRLWASRDEVRAGMVEVRERATPYFRHVLDEMVEYGQLRAGLVTVQDPPWRSETLVERCARILARRGDPLTPSQLRDGMKLSGGEQATAAAIKRAMTGHRSFVRLSGDRYQIGRPVLDD